MKKSSKHLFFFFFLNRLRWNACFFIFFMNLTFFLIDMLQPCVCFRVEVLEAQWEVESQALFSEWGGHLVCECGQLWWFAHVDAAGGGDFAKGAGWSLCRHAGGFNHNVCAVVSASLRLFTEHQLVRFNLKEKRTEHNYSIQYLVLAQRFCLSELCSS